MSICLRASGQQGATTTLRCPGGGMTLQMTTQSIKPARGGIVQARATFLRRGRSINYLESRMTDADGALMAVASSTWRLL